MVTMMFMCASPTSAVDCGRVAVLSGRVALSAPKRLRSTSRNLRISQASTLPVAEFDLTRANSDSDIQVALQDGKRGQDQEQGTTFFLSSSGLEALRVFLQTLLCHHQRFRQAVMSHVSGRRARQWDQDTGDSDTDSDAGSVRQEDTVSVVDDPADIAMPRAPTLMHAFRNMDDVDVERIFSGTQ